MEKLEWNITAVAEMIKELNEYGSLAKNAIAGIYNMFRYKISEKWQGKSYNSVVRYFNSYSNDWITMVKFLGEEIPTGLAQICMNQAEVNQSEVQLSSSYYLASDNNNPDIYPLNESNENLNTTLEPEEVEQYLRGSTDPSVKVRADLAIFYLESYINVFNNHAPDYNYDEAVSNLCNGAKPYIEKFKSDIDEIMENTIKVALGEIETIEELDIETIEIADEAIGGEVLSGSEGNISGSDAATNDTSKITKYYDINSSTYQEKYHAYKDLDEEYISATELEEARNEYNDLNKKKPGSPEAIAAGEKYNKMAETFKNQTTTQADVDAKEAEWKSFEERNNAAKKLKDIEIENRKARREADKTIQKAEEDRQAAYDVANKKYDDTVNKANDGADKAQGDYDDALNEYLEKYGNPDNQ